MTDVKLSVPLDIRGLQNTVLPGRYPPQVQCNTLKQLEKLNQIYRSLASNGTRFKSCGTSVRNAFK
jgi:hypothetical protein